MVKRIFLIVVVGVFAVSCGTYRKIQKSQDPELKYNAAKNYFQDGMGVSTLKYNIDYSTLGTQSCNGRIPTMGLKTIYLGFENERMRYANYLWIEAVSAVPNTEYFKEKYSVY